MAIQCIGRLGSTTSKAHVSLPWELRQSAKPSAPLHLSISPSVLNHFHRPRMLNICRLRASCGRTARSHKDPKRKKKEEGGICFEKKGASQTVKAPMLPPNDTERATTRQTLGQCRPASGETAISVPLGGREKGGGGGKPWHSVRLSDAATVH
ncbi:uncharacterized protein LY79DRAFT_556042 [Colletotrichum navitas]|uniref:Uncharacterized protein n=1 Tax=Colletotrichum navitas TaxID=681940 RepID=A0AAD8PXG7_9PEZI|nr:uncharacterized protein LY79DRAFT_556042 [Colletotrichum navitas]KAK1589903.1 hypothetical protein LY79DRAFT_556042 [Colletotrichum navitas]